MINNENNEIQQNVFIQWYFRWYFKYDAFDYFDPREPFQTGFAMLQQHHRLNGAWAMEEFHGETILNFFFSRINVKKLFRTLGTELINLLPQIFKITPLFLFDVTLPRTIALKN